MAALTFADLITNKTVKRGDKGFSVKIEDIHFRPGFNHREEGPRLDRELQLKAQFTFDNGIDNMPQLKVEPREEGGVWAVDGHCRTRATRIAIEMGAKPKIQSKDGNVWMPVKPFIGDELARNFEVISSQNNLNLSPLELAHGFKTVRDLGATATDIAKRTGYDRQYVDQMLVLSSGGPDIHEMVRAGLVSADIAQDFIRKHGDQAAAELRKEYENAKSQGKTKVTKGTIKGKSLPSAVVADVTSHLRAVVQSIPKDARKVLEQYRAEKITDPETMVSIPVRELLALTMCVSHIDDVEAEQVRKAKLKADKAAEKAKAAGGAEATDDQND